MTSDLQTEQVRRAYDKAAGRYERQIGVWEKLLFPGEREWICERATGDVLELAVGTGSNLAHYPKDVSLSGIELSPEMLAIARKRAAALEREVDLQLGDVQALPFADSTFDTVVCTLSLCTIPDDRQAVSEARRVLRGDGRLLLLEHVRSPSRPVRLVQRAIDPIAVKLQHDHLVRDPTDYLEDEGFAIEQLDRSKLGLMERVVARAR